MKKKLFFVISVAGFMSYAFAQDEKPVELSVTRVRSEIIANLPQDLPAHIHPDPAREYPLYMGGKYDFRYLVTGTHIAGIKEDSLVLTKFQVKDDKNFSRTTLQGVPNIDMARFWGLKEDISDDGRYALFRLRIKVDEAIATELPIFEGTVDVYIADGKETHVLKLSDDDNQSYKVGDYTIRISERNATPFSVSVMGAKEGVAGLQVFVKEQEIQNYRREWGLNQQSWDYDIKGSRSDVTVNLMLWKNLRTQTVSFQ